jgi:hypothetical protein
MQMGREPQHPMKFLTEDVVAIASMRLRQRRLLNSELLS